MTLAAAPLVSIIVPVHNQWAFTWKCLMAVASATREIPHEIIVIDNGSSDETAAGLAALDNVRSRRNDANLGFGAACNQGAAMARAPFLLFLNNDTEPQPGWLAAMLRVMDADAQVAVVNPRLVFPDGTIQHAGFIIAYGFPYPVTAIPREYRKPASAASERVELRAASGACLLVRAPAFSAASGFDDTFINGYEDIDLCFRIGLAGGRIIYAPDALVVHHEAISGGRFKNEAGNQDRFQQRWMGRWTRFDYDYRVTAGRAPGDPARPGVSVVVVARNALGTVIPCLENVLCCLGPQDELLIVDDGGQGAAAGALDLFDSGHADVARVVRGGGASPARLGLQAARHDFVAVMPANVKVGPRWLERLVAHLRDDAGIGVVTPSGSGNPVRDNRPIYAPPDARSFLKSSVLDKLVTAGPRTTLVPATACLVGRRRELLALADAPSPLWSDQPAALATALRARGLRLTAALDVFATRINQQATEPHVLDRERYLLQQSANLAAEQRRAEGGDPGTVRIGGVAAQLGLASIVILVRDNLLLTTECVESIYRHTARDFELILVDNGSAPDVAAYLGELQAAQRNVVCLRNPQNEGFPWAVNQGLAAARGEYVVVLNNDVVVTHGWLSRQLALLAMDAQVGVVGPTTNATSGPQLVGTATYGGLGDVDRFAEQWAIEHSGELAFVPRLTGLCLVMRRSLIDTIGGFDTIFGYGNCEDDDFCLRVLRAGQRIAIAFDVFIHHHGSATFKAMSLQASHLVADNWAIFCQKWQHDGPHTAEALRALGEARRFDPDADFIPVDNRAVFHPDAPALEVDTRRPVRLLLVPDWRDDRWPDALEIIFRAVSQRDPVAIVLRVDPPTAALVDRAVAGVNDTLTRLGMTIDQAPDIVIEASAIPARRRGGLYTAATAYVTTQGPRDRFTAREAAACGLPILDPTEVRAFVDKGASG